MWDQEYKIDEEKKKMITDKLESLGLSAEQIDGDLIWMFKKLSHKVNKLRLMFDKKGIGEPMAREIIEKMFIEAMNKDMADVKKWNETHQEMGGHEGCCQHCHHCHHEDSTMPMEAGEMTE